MTQPDLPAGDPSGTGDPAELAARVAAVVATVPGVMALHGGTFGDIASYLPGRKVTGVRIGRPDEPVEVAVVVGLHRPIPAVVADVRRAVAGLCGDGPIDVTVADVTDVVVIDGPAIDGPAIGAATTVVLEDGPVAGSRRVQ